MPISGHDYLTVHTLPRSRQRPPPIDIAITITIDRPRPVSSLRLSAPSRVVASCRQSPLAL